jgi:hypothetical protein
MAIAAGEDILAADILGLVSFETTSGTTHSLTTVASEKVLVIAKGKCTPGGGTTINLQYNSVTKDSVTLSMPSGGDTDFCLMYTETPGAATQNIAITGSSGNEKIIVIKLKQA